MKTENPQDLMTALEWQIVYIGAKFLKRLKSRQTREETDRYRTNLKYLLTSAN